MFQEPKVHIIEILKNNDNNKINTLLKMYAIVQIPTIKEIIIINFDPFFSPSFQGLNDFDIFPDYDTAYKYIKSINDENDITYNEITATAIAGYISNFRLLLIDKAEPISFQNQEIIYKINSFKKIVLDKDKMRQETESYQDNFFYSFSSDIIYFQEKKNNSNYNYFHLNQKPFRRLQTNICPFIINGYVSQGKMSDSSEVLLICRRSRFSKEISSGMNENGITRNLTEIEMIISNQTNIGNELSFFTVAYGDVPIIYKNPTEVDEYAFINSPKFIFNLLGERKDKMKNDIFLINATQQIQQQQQQQQQHQHQHQQQPNAPKKIDINLSIKQMVSFLSGVFNINHIQIDIDTNIKEDKIIEYVYSLIPNIKMRKQLFYNNNIFHINDSNQNFYVCSDIGNFNAEFVSLILLSKAFKSVFPNFKNPPSFIFLLISPFLKKIVNSTKNNLPFLKGIVEIQPIKYKKEDLNPPENMERCVSLFPTSTIISPNNLNSYILSSIPTRIFYETPNDPIIINLTEACRVSRIAFSPVNNEKSGNIFNISASMVSIYGGLYLNQMFPIVENLALSPTAETLFKVNLLKNERYSIEPKCAKYGIVRFISFKFQSIFKGFYISNISVYTDGSKVIELPKDIKNKDYSMLKEGHKKINFEYEIQRIKDQESIPNFVFKNPDKIQDLISIDSYFTNFASSKKDKLQYFNLINNILMDNELVSMYKQYPFLHDKFNLKSNFMKCYSSNSIYMPFLVASGPQLFEYVNSRQFDLDDFKFFKPKESIVILRLVLLQNYPIGSIEIRCNTPITVEVLNSDFNFKDLFLPPGGEQFFEYNKRVVDIKLQGNPINISFLGFRPSSRKNSNKVNFDALTNNKKKEINDDDIIKCKENGVSINDSKISNKNSSKVIGFKFNPNGFYSISYLSYHGSYNPQYFVFGDQAFYVKMNPRSTFFFPIITSDPIKIFDKGAGKNTKNTLNATIIVLQLDEKDTENQNIQGKLKKVPHYIQIKA